MIIQVVSLTGNYSITVVKIDILLIEIGSVCTSVINLSVVGIQMITRVVQGDR